MSIGSMLKKLFGMDKGLSQEKSLKDLEAEGILTGVDGIEIEGGGGFRTVDENTPDYWGKWDPNDIEEYYRRTEEINQAQAQGAGVLKAVLKKYGCKNYEEYERIQMTFIKNGMLKGEDAQNKYMEGGVAWAMNKQKDELAAQLTPELLAPIDGIDLEKYATIMAKRTQLKTTEEGHALLAEYGLDEARFNAIDQGWQARMRQEDGGHALMTEYGKYFAAAGQGRHGAAGQAGAPGIGVDGKAGQAPSASAEPGTFEKFVEVMAAQTAWGTQGRDVNAMLLSTFNMTAADWSNMSAYWFQKMTADASLINKMGDLQAKYTAKYSAGGGADDDLSF